MAGPRPKPGLAVGFLSSAFTTAENQKLTNHTSFENLTRPTEDMCFQFLICEAKRGLDYAERQNMHSCSIAVKALLKLEQKADQYRVDKRFGSLLGKILVYSISHNERDARIYGHFALVEGEKWMYFRHYIAGFDISHEESDLLALHNFAHNVLTLYAPKLLKSIQEAIAALPVSSMLSVSAGTMSMDDESRRGSQLSSHGRDAEGFAIPGLPASLQEQFDKQKEDDEARIQQLMQQIKDNESRFQQLMKQLEQQRKDSEG